MYHKKIKIKSNVLNWKMDEPKEGQKRLKTKKIN
jgi:hypothetical protein